LRKRLRARIRIIVLGTKSGQGSKPHDELHRLSQTYYYEYCDQFTMKTLLAVVLRTGKVSWVRLVIRLASEKEKGKAKLMVNSPCSWYVGAGAGEDVELPLLLAVQMQNAEIIVALLEEGASCDALCVQDDKEMKIRDWENGQQRFIGNQGQLGMVLEAAEKCRATIRIVLLAQKFGINTLWYLMPRDVVVQCILQPFVFPFRFRVSTLTATVEEKQKTISYRKKENRQDCHGKCKDKKKEINEK
jgi:hypothetical protein